jgi:hypothetical protein
MKWFNSYRKLVLLPLFFLSAGFANISHHVYGTVYGKQSGKPIAGVYLYTVQGEEEGLTDKQGEFRFKTWQRFPVILYVHESQNKVTTVTVSSPSQQIAVRL